MMPLRLACVDVRHVDLDERQRYAGERIANGKAGVRVRAGVDDDAVDASAHRVNGVDHRPFAVVLRELDLDAQLAADRAQIALDVVERVTAVDLRLTGAE